MSHFKESLRKFNQNLNILEERQAKYAGNAPLDLLNQVEDHKTAITLTEQALAGSITEEAWRAALKPLLLAFDRNIFLDSSHVYEQPPPPLSPVEAKERRELTILLQKVKQFWIEGVLEKSLHNIALIDLGKETQAEAVAHAWEQILELPDQSRQTLPPDKKISYIFDDMNRALLILGAPGSGKTITLLQLARDLIAQAERDETFSQPVPVIFNLSTWQRGQPLVDWLVEELSVKYQIPKRIGQPWLENNRLLPLLDGLDEVRDEDRTACVEAINHFGQEYGLSGLVVCSRTEEYTRLPVRLKLNGAISLQPLTLEQVYDYLDAAGSKLDALREALQADRDLQELVKSPLILGIMSLAYQDVSVEALTHESLSTAEARRQHLLDTYIERMFKRKGEQIKLYANEQTKSWLSWLAQRMLQHNQSIFLIEQLQPSWLSNREWIWGYALGSRSLSALFAWPLFALVMATYWVEIFGLTNTLLFRPYGWLLWGLIAGLSLGFVTGIIFGLQFESKDKRVTDKKNDLAVQSIKILAISVIFGAISSIIAGLFTETRFGILIGLGTGVLFGLYYWVKGQQQHLTYDIQTVEALNWSWQRALRFAFLGLIGGFIVGFVIGLVAQQDQEMVSEALKQRLFFGLIGEVNFAFGSGVFWALLSGVGAALFGGLNSKVVETKTIPNQGVWLTSRNSLLIGLGFGLTMGLIIRLVIPGESGGLGNGLLFGIIAAYFYGVLDIIQHFTLRFILWYNGHTPRDYAHFLDYAAERIFLQKVGGGYIFIHRLLLEHFATMGTAETTE